MSPMSVYLGTAQFEGDFSFIGKCDNDVPYL